MPLTPITRTENFLARIAGDPAEELAPITRTEHFLQRIIDTGGGGGGGGSVTPADIVSATGNMTAEQAEDTRGNLDVDEAPFVLILSISDTTYSVDHTYAETVAALTAGKRIVLNVGVSVVPMIQGSSNFYAYLISNDGTTVTVIDLASNDAVSVESKTFQLEPTVAIVSGATPTISPQNHVEYVCGTLTSLTVSSPPVTGSYVIKFDSGSTATTTTIPNTIHGLESFAAEVNTHYEINVEDNYAVIGSWAVSS